MTTTTTTAVLVPGAWMAEWIWEPTAYALRKRGLGADTLTLRGLADGTSPADAAAVRLSDHVDELAAFVEKQAGPVVLVGHSYSSMVTGQVADRLGDRVRGLVHVGGFLPEDGRSLLDGWGDSAEARRQEEADIEAAGGLWAAPTLAMLQHEVGLSADDREFLAARLVAHPGRTVTDPAVLRTDLAAQPTTYVALSASGAEQAWAEAPEIARRAPGWRRRHIGGGHWPMVSRPDEMIELLADELAHYS